MFRCTEFGGLRFAQWGLHMRELYHFTPYHIEQFQLLQRLSSSDDIDTYLTVVEALKYRKLIKKGANRGKSCIHRHQT